MLSRKLNLICVSLFGLLSSCYLSDDISHSTEVDAETPPVGTDEPSDIGGGSLSVDGNPSVDNSGLSKEDDKPIVDAGTEEISLKGTWRGKWTVPFISDGEIVSSMISDCVFEFSDTEVVITLIGGESFRGDYFIDNDSTPYRMDIKIDPSSIFANIPNGLVPFIYKIENNTLTLATGGTMVAPSIPPSFDVRNGATLLIELTHDPQDDEIPTSSEV